MRLDIDLVVHGHFYQPPREDPWTDEVPRGIRRGAVSRLERAHRLRVLSANAVARVYLSDRILERWQQLRGAHLRLRSDARRAGSSATSRWCCGGSIAADRAARGAAGHGNAIAHPYFHAILPLARSARPRDADSLGPRGLPPPLRPRGARLLAARDRGRPPDARRRSSITASSSRSSRPIRRRVPGRSAAAWNTITRRAPRHRRGPIATCTSTVRGASGRLLLRRPLAQASPSAARCARARLSWPSWRGGGATNGGLVHVAVDGETFGHHARYGERVLAHALSQVLGPRAGAGALTTAKLAAHPPTRRSGSDLGEDGRGTSWSCAHGIGRWMRNCGCRQRPGPNQAWRTPLREAFNLLKSAARGLSRHHRRPAARSLGGARRVRRRGCWAVRSSRFLAAPRWPISGRANAVDWPSPAALQRDLLAMFTSCGWFFDDVSGLETALVMR